MDKNQAAQEAAKLVASANDDPSWIYVSITGIYVFLLSMWGGLVGFIRRSQGQPFDWGRLAFELFISGLVGFCTFCLCYWSGVFQIGDLKSAALTSVVVAVASSMGSRALAIYEQPVRNLLRLLVGKQPEDKA
jgi:hypothetical protein